MKVLNRLKVQADEVSSIPLTEGGYNISIDKIGDYYYVNFLGSYLDNPTKDLSSAITKAADELLDDNSHYSVLWDISEVTKKQKNYDGGLNPVKFVGKEGKVMLDYLRKAILKDSPLKNEFIALQRLSVDGFSYEQAVTALNSLEEFLNF